MEKLLVFSPQSFLVPSLGSMLFVLFLLFSHFDLPSSKFCLTQVCIPNVRFDVGLVQLSSVSLWEGKAISDKPSSASRFLGEVPGALPNGMAQGGSELRSDGSRDPRPSWLVCPDPPQLVLLVHARATRVAPLLFSTIKSQGSV